jgi:transcriptional regulator with XRE-family HTH domain
MSSHVSEDNSTLLNASILTTPQWQRERELNIHEPMARKLVPERNVGVAQRLLWTRRALGMPQNKFATSAGISPTAYNQWETGQTFPPADAAIKLCEAHDLSLDWIYRAKMGALPAALADAIKGMIALDSERQPKMKVVEPPKRRRA